MAVRHVTTSVCGVLFQRLYLDRFQDTTTSEVNLLPVTLRTPSLLITTTVRPKCRSPTRPLGTEVGPCLSSSSRAPLAVHSGTDQLPSCRSCVSFSERYGATVPGQSAPSSFRHRRTQTAALQLDVNAAGPAFVAQNNR